METTIFYDGDCPFCTDYVGFTKLREAAGRVALVDLRQAPEARQAFLQDGLDPDKGMIVTMSGQTYHGADAINVLSLMSSRHGAMNALASTIFRNRVLAQALYPVLRAGRNAAVLVMGSDRMDGHDRAAEAQYRIFAQFLGLFSVLHALYYFFRATPSGFSMTEYPLLALGFGLILAPQARVLFILTLATLAVSGWLNAPAHSNHTMLLNTFVATLIAAGLWHTLRGSSWATYFRDVRPVGRCLLLIMYTFGIFHKINTGFLNPEVSCAVVLWRDMPPPLVWIDTPAMHYLAIYGTFAVEGLIMLMLIVPKWRHLGVCLGIGFHALLALSGYAMYPVFSTLAIVLHTLFLSSASALAISQSAAWQHFQARLVSAPGIAILLGAVALIGYFAMERDYGMVAFVWLLLVVGPLIIIAVEGAADPQSDRIGPQFVSPLLALNAITVLFFLNAMSPYIGLKNTQAMNMFANLRVEGGINNHLIIPEQIGPFTYLDDLVRITSVNGAPPVMQGDGQLDLAVVHQQFLTMLQSVGPDVLVAYERNGVPHPAQPAGQILAANADGILPAWLRKFVHFDSVIMDLPRPC